MLLFIFTDILFYLFRWSTKYNSQLFLYGEDNGVIWDVAVNYSEPYSKLYTVGLFDTVTQTSQVQLCSVAKFDGINFEKVMYFLLLFWEVSYFLVCVGGRRLMLSRRR